MRYPVVFWDSGGTIFSGGRPEGSAGIPSPREVREGRAFRAARVLEMFRHNPPADLERRIEDLEGDLQNRLGPWYSLEALAVGLYTGTGMGERREEALLLADALGGPRYRSWLWDGVAEALGTLHRAGVRMGLIANTDWTSRMMRRALDGVRLAEFFGPVVCSCDIGVQKPDPRIFAVALASLTPPAPAGVPLLYVGDSPAADIAGAAACGWDAALHLTGPVVSPHGAVLAFTDYRDLVRLVIDGT